MSTPALATFELSPDLEAAAPPEERGLARDGVRLMVAHRLAGSIEHSRFDRIAEHLHPGDALVVNVSRTLPAAVPAISPRGEELVLHFSSPYPADERLWVVEPRLARRRGHRPLSRRAHGRPARAPGRCVDRPARAVPRRAAVGRPAPDGRLGRELPAAPRRADPVRVRRRRVGPRRLPDHLRHRAGQRRDAERGAAVHRPHARRAGGAGRPGHPDRAPLRRVVARGPREPATRAVRRLGRGRSASERRARCRRTGRRGRHHGRARPRVRGRRRRADPCHVRLDGRRHRRPTAP